MHKARGGRIEDFRVRVMIGHERAQVGLTGRLLSVPSRRDSQRLARGGTQPPPVAVPQLSVEDELALLVAHALSSSLPAALQPWGLPLLEQLLPLPEQETNGHPQSLPKENRVGLARHV